MTGTAQVQQGSLFPLTKLTGAGGAPDAVATLAPSFSLVGGSPSTSDGLTISPFSAAPVPQGPATPPPPQGGGGGTPPSTGPATPPTTPPGTGPATPPTTPPGTGPATPPPPTTPPGPATPSPPKPPVNGTPAGPATPPPPQVIPVNPAM